MNTAKKMTGFALAATAAAMFAMAPMNVSAGSDKSGKCYGVNSCKGLGACAGATNACVGQNNCKGEGWVKRTKADCTNAGGNFVS